MKRLLLASAMLVALAVPARAEPPLWTIQRDASSIIFEAMIEGQPVEGELPEFAGTIRFSPDNLAGSSCDIRIPLASVTTRNSERDMTLKSRDFFAVDQFPTARFAAKGFSKLPDGRYAAPGSLTIRDVEQPLNLVFNLTLDPQTDGTVVATMRAETVVNRLDFAVGGGQWADPGTIAPEVTVRIGVIAKSVPGALELPSPVALTDLGIPTVPAPPASAPAASAASAPAEASPANPK